VGDQKVTDPRSLARIVGNLRPDHATDLIVMRDGSNETLKVTTAKLPDQTADATDTTAPSPSGRLGLAMAPLDSDARDNLGLGPNVKGAVITEVRPDSPAASAGLQPGDVITGVGNQRVTSPDDAVKAIRGQKGSVALRILRDGHNLYVAVGGSNAG
jgi:serine protease Do